MSLFFEEVKRRTGYSGNRIAKEIDASPELVSRWNTDKSQPNGLNTVKLMELANIDRDEAIRLMNGGFTSISMLLVVAVLSVVCFLGITQLSPTHHIASSKAQSNVYYVK